MTGDYHLVDQAPVRCLLRAEEPAGEEEYVGDRAREAAWQEQDTSCVRQHT